MNITFYYVPGISELDTPVFDTLANQSSFFAESEPVTIEMGFYPPFLKNTILVDISDYNLTTSVANYCSLEFNNKKFYYFITSKEYVNESVVRLNIKMDTIQTYMFDADFINAFLDRITINRWVRRLNGTLTNNINRNYIRENLSTNNFTTIKYYQEFNTGTMLGKDNIYEWAYIFKYTTKNDTPSLNSIASKIQGNGSADTKYSGWSPYMYGVAFVNDCDVTYNGTTYTIKPDYAISMGIVQPNVCDAYLIPFKCLRGVSHSSAGSLNTLPLGYTVDVIAAGQLHGWDLIFCSPFIDININTNETTIVSELQSKPSYGDLFNPYKQPVMLDENYINFTFGDSNIRTEYPLYTLIRPTVYLSYWADISNGYRYYNIHLEENKIYENRYATIVMNASAFKVDLKNDLWSTYIANNRATLEGALLTTGTTTLTSTIGGYLAAGPGGAGSNLARGLGQMGNTLLNYYTNMTNLKHAPKTIKRVGSHIPDLLTGNSIVSSKTFYCDDFEDVAKFYESYGYKVAYNTIENLFETNNRYLYDYIKTKEISVVIGDKNVESDFCERFNKGLRLWHTEYGVLNCKDLHLNLGQVCIYDNVEVELVPSD